MEQGRALGIGLMALGGVLGGLVLLWLVVNAAGGELRPGGFVLGLFLLAVLALPPIGVGYYLVQRARVEQAEAAGFVGRRRVLEADRLFRADLARELRQLASRLSAAPGHPSGTGVPLGTPPAAELHRLRARLDQLVEDLERPGISEAAWYEAVQLTDRDLDALRAYDDLISAGERRLARLVDELEAGRADAAELAETVHLLEEQLRERQQLLRGKRPVAVSPTRLLEAAGARATGSVADLDVGDAVSYVGDDYLVDATVTYFSGGRTWRLHRLGGGPGERWLYVSPGALDVFLLDRTEPPASSGASVTHAGQTCALADHGVASATVRSAAGEQSGVTLDYWRYACPDGQLVLVERWPDERRAYAGRPIRPGALEIWPRAREA